ncbi:MAG: serine/threonine protein kinase [Pirellulaceae bacterium]
MSHSDHTQQQSLEEQRQAQERSLRRSRPPVEVPGYALDEFLGAGAFGEVWIGIDRNTGRRVAIKFYLHRGGVDWSLLAREVKHLVSLSADRYIVQVLAVGWDADPPYYVMEYVENGSLEDLLQQQAALPPARAEQLFHEIAIGLLHSHGKGVLHCDLKPANILLDQDHRPRLADFGQSRLSSEQKPALGTLFYMAPEQADLEAVPDARWDVYALGAIYYRMVTGHPPHRDNTTTRDIESATSLPQRLERYRRLIRQSKPPTRHAHVRGVDRALAAIIDRCLAADPNNRFANVQEVLDALRRRAEARTRRPLMLLGVLGPLLLLMVMAVFGWRGYLEAKRQSTDAIRQRAYESNAFAAKFVASALEAEIERYFDVAERESRLPDLQARLNELRSYPLVDRLHAADNDPARREPLREQFVADPERDALTAHLRSRLDSYLDLLDDDPNAAKFASIFITDERGMIVAAVYDDEQVSTKSVGGNYAWRTYFHGGPVELPRDMRTPAIRPLLASHLSAVFQSTTTNLWKVAISTPVIDNETRRTIGVLVMTVNMGDFAVLRNDNVQSDRFAVLVDGREGTSHGTILQHPLFAREGDTSARYEYSKPEYRVTNEQLDQVASNWRYQYVDPLSTAPKGVAYKGTWIAALEPVQLPERNEANASPRDSELMVLVQESEQEATRPVRSLGSRLVREGILALFVVLCGVLALWYFVVHIMSSPTPWEPHRPLPTTTSTPVHDATTLAVRDKS